MWCRKWNWQFSEEAASGLCGHASTNLLTNCFQRNSRTAKTAAAVAFNSVYCDFDLLTCFSFFRYLTLHLLQLMTPIWKCAVIYYVVSLITLFFSPWVCPSWLCLWGTVIQKLDWCQGKLDYVSQCSLKCFIIPRAEGIMWLLADALCSAHYYSDAVSMSSLTAHYDLLYTSPLQRPSLYSMSHSGGFQAEQAPAVCRRKSKFSL